MEEGAEGAEVRVRRCSLFGMGEAPAQQRNRGREAALPLPGGRTACDTRGGGSSRRVRPAERQSEGPVNGLRLTDALLRGRILRIAGRRMSLRLFDHDLLRVLECWRRWAIDVRPAEL